MLKRKIEVDSSEPGLIDRMSYRELIREGAERGFVSNPAKWFVYREDRNLTSHTYDEKIAKRVYKRALDFIKDAENLLEKLKERNL
jgi:nucleotidyltransferase substrate binding protein (TIGR01987 family)